MEIVKPLARARQRMQQRDDDALFRTTAGHMQTGSVPWGSFSHRPPAYRGTAHITSRDCRRLWARQHGGRPGW